MAKMNDDETVAMSEKPYKTISAARAAATIKAKAEQGETFIIYKRTDYWHFVPLEYKTIAHESEV